MKRLPELRRWLDSMGITLKGRQDRRWEPPRPKRTTSWRSTVDDDHPYAHLRFTSDGTEVDRERDPRFRTSTKERLQRVMAEEEQRRRLSVLER